MDTSEFSPASESGIARPTLFAVFGQPVTHSLSPRIHMAFGQQLGIALQYGTIEASSHEFPARLNDFAKAGGMGANITLPFKEQALDLCVNLSDRARRAGCVNTLTRLSGGWAGDNTDGSGFIRDITERHQLDVRGRRALLLGAGGGARSVGWALLDAGVRELVIVNRTPERADVIADAIGDPERVHTRYWQDLAQCGNFEMVVNATSAAHSGDKLNLPTALLTPRALCYDLSYGQAAVGFLAWAKSAGAAQALDGLGMLVEQAADSFELWHGKRPDTGAVYGLLHKHVPRDAVD